MKEIYEMKGRGHSARAIARELGLARNTVLLLFDKGVELHGELQQFPAQYPGPGMGILRHVAWTPGLCRCSRWPRLLIGIYLDAFQPSRR